MQLPEVPLPTQDYAERHARERLRSIVTGPYVGPPVVDEGPAPAGPRTAAPPAAPMPTPGARVFIYKQDPSVAEIAVRKAFLPKRRVRRAARRADRDRRHAGRDAERLRRPGRRPLRARSTFDAVHTFAIVRMTLTMYERLEGARRRCPGSGTPAATPTPITCSRARA